MLAFLFTDLESSTRMWEAYPDLMGGALAEHDRILREAVEGHSGTVVKTTGDGMLAIFQSVPMSLAAGIEAQRGLSATRWATPEPLRVRMGIHVGEAEARAGDYFGTDVNRAARIMAAGHGGQVLVSDAVAALAGDLELRDLGRHRLKDLTEAVHLYQVAGPGLDADFPPLATLAGTPNNLPVQVSEFIGRADLLAAAMALLHRDGVRLVTLLGPGGTGKTRLGLQMAAEALEEYPDGVFFVDLSEERTPDGAFEAVVRELGLTGAREGTPLQVLKAKLREGRRLLVLDNLEQVTDAAPGVAELLAFCPGLEIVATSRETLDIRGEHSFPVPTLGLPDPADAPERMVDAEAVRLFVERARAVRPDLALDDHTVGVIAEITRELDGLPLAIELAAARLQVFDPVQLRDRLRERADALGEGGRDLPDRQRTLRGAVAWSYELLDEDECRLFELMSVFPSARLDEVESVARRVHPDLAAVDVLLSLVAKSLVRRVDDGGSRFSMLRVIRDYAAGRLAGGGEQAAREAHAGVYTDFAEAMGDRLGSAGIGEVPPELLVEVDNLQAAWRHLVAIGDGDRLSRLYEVLWAVAESRGWYHAAIQLNGDLLDVSGSGSSTGAVDELGVRVRLARALMAIGGYTPEVQGHFERALELADADDLRTRGPVLRALATYFMNTGDMDESRRLGAELVELGDASGDDAAVAEGHVVMGAVTFDLPLAIDHLQRAIEVSDRLRGASRFRQGALPGIIARMAGAVLLARVGRLDDATALTREGLATARGLDHPFSLAYALHHAAYFWMWQAGYGEAAELAAELTALSREHDYPVWGALGSIMEGVARAGLGEGADAIARAAEGLELYQGLATPPVFWMPLQAVRGLGLLLAGDAEGSRAILDEVLELPGADVVYPEFRVLLADTAAALGDEQAAVASLRIGLDAARTAGAKAIELAALRRLVERGEAPVDTLADLLGGVEAGGAGPETEAAARVLAGA